MPKTKQSQSNTKIKEVSCVLIATYLRFVFAKS